MSGKRAKRDRKAVRERVTIEEVVSNDIKALMGDDCLTILVPGMDAIAVCEQFVSKHVCAGYGLAIFNILTGRIEVEINCPVSEIGSILSYIYCLEHAEPIAWISANDLLGSYVVAMPLCRGCVSGCYRADGGKLKFLGEIS